jgi:hypothetical protein
MEPEIGWLAFYVNCLSNTRPKKRGSVLIHVPLGSSCSPCLRGELVFGLYHHGGTENTEGLL